MDFAALPPEVNSALMYSGAGAGPLLSAAAAWMGLGVELNATATSFETVVSQLTGELWMGPASLSAAAAAQPYIAWLTYTGAAAEQAGAQAMASAAAYEAAFAATVPPPIVAANRTLLAALVATNVLGVNTPAIVATEALYMEMWAQDALAMYTYAASSGAAGLLEPLTPPSQTTNPGGAAAQAAAVGSAAAVSPATQTINDLIGNLPTALSSLASPVQSVLDATGLSGIITDLDAFFAIPLVGNVMNGGINTAAWFVMAAIPNAIFLSNALAPAEAAATAVEGAGAAAAGAAAGLAGQVAPAAGAAGVGAALGEASLVGSLSVPASWASATPATTAATALAGSGWTVPEEGGRVSGMAGMPGMAAAAKGAGAYAGPRYGFKPTVMPKQIVV